MRTYVQSSFGLVVLTAVFGSVLAGQLEAQTFTTVYDFTELPTWWFNTPNNTDGAYPVGGLVLSGSTLYGAASGGGPELNGTVFAVNTDGTGFTTLYTFTGLDGAQPCAGLTLSGNTLYGTTFNGGSSGWGTVFKVNTNGTGFTTLYNFTALSVHDRVNGTNSDGAQPCGALVLAGDTLYGTASVGGGGANGTVFKLNTDGTGFTTLHSFTPTASVSPFGNTDGGNPSGPLVQSGGTLYGVAGSGGSWGNGTVYAVDTNGTGFTTVYSFTASSTNGVQRNGGYWVYTNSDGAGPVGGLVLLGNTLYGAANGGGSSGYGTVFKVNTDGTGFAILHTFSAISAYWPYGNSDGGWPAGELILSGNTLYGTSAGGSTGSGTIFAVNTDGTDFTNLYTFSLPTCSAPSFYSSYCTNTDGDGPSPGLTLAGNTLYGATDSCGNFDSGTIFSISLPPSQLQLTITPLPGAVALTWPTNSTAFTLQSTTNLTSPVWTANLPAPVVVNGQDTATNPISGTQQFWRLSRQD